MSAGEPPPRRALCFGLEAPRPPPKPLSAESARLVLADIGRVGQLREGHAETSKSPLLFGDSTNALLEPLDASEISARDSSPPIRTASFRTRQGKGGAGAQALTEPARGLVLCKDDSGLVPIDEPERREGAHEPCFGLAVAVPSLPLPSPLRDHVGAVMDDLSDLCFGDEGGEEEEEEGEKEEEGEEEEGETEGAEGEKGEGESPRASLELKEPRRCAFVFGCSEDGHPLPLNADLISPGMCHSMSAILSLDLTQHTATPGGEEGGASDAQGPGEARVFTCSVCMCTTRASSGSITRARAGSWAVASEWEAKDRPGVWCPWCNRMMACWKCWKERAEKSECRASLHELTSQPSAWSVEDHRRALCPCCSKTLFRKPVLVFDCTE